MVSAREVPAVRLYELTSQDLSLYRSDYRRHINGEASANPALKARANPSVSRTKSRTKKVLDASQVLYNFITLFP